MGVVSCTTSPCGIHFSLSVFLSCPSSFYTSTLGGSQHQLLSCYRSGNREGNFFPTGYRLISSFCTSNQGDNPQNEAHLSSFCLSCTIYPLRSLLDWSRDLPLVHFSGTNNPGGIHSFFLTGTKIPVGIQHCQTPASSCTSILEDNIHMPHLLLWLIL